MILIAVLLIAGAAFAVYQPALRGAWLWDDPTEIVHNPVLQLPASDALPQIWRGAGAQDYLPLKTTVQWMEWHLWGSATIGYHLVNLALHVLAAVLLGKVLFRLGAAPAAALFGALLFAVHPMAVLSVAWISELKNCLSLPLLLGSFLFFLRGARRRSLALFAAAGLVKGSVLPFPAFLLLYAWWRRGRATREDGRAVAPFFLVAGVLAAVTVHFQSARVLGPLGVVVAPLGARLLQAGPALAFYLLDSLSPLHLPIYAANSLSPFGPLLGLLAGWGLIVALAALAARFSRTAAFALGGFVLFLLPVIDVVPLAYARIAPVSDHLGYIALLFPVGLAAAALTRWGGHGPAWLAAALVCLGAAAAARSYAHEFTSEERLWRYTLARNPDAWLAHNNLGIALAESGRLEEAIVHFESALRVRPELDRTRSNLARARESLRVAHNNRGADLARAHRLPEAIAEFRAAIAADPADPGVHRNLAMALHFSGRDREALAELEAAEHLAYVKVQSPNPLPGTGQSAGLDAQPIPAR